MSNENKDYIEGIFNYCDRWCEKCKFTANCLLFTQESKIKTYEILHKGDTSGIGSLLDEEINKLESEYSEEEDGLEDYLDEELFNSYEEEKQNYIEENEEIEDVKYPIEDLVNEYFSKSFSLIKSISEKYNFDDSSKDNPKSLVAQKIFNDFEIFSWYHAFIGAKIKRALGDLDDLRNEDDYNLIEIHTQDMNGSAKIGIISIKKSITALNNLHETLHDFSAEIEGVLVLLGKILNQTDELFPECMKFIRPGLDE